MRTQEQIQMTAPPEQVFEIMGFAVPESGLKFVALGVIVGMLIVLKIVKELKR